MTDQPLSERLAGRSLTSEAYVVTAERVAEYAASIGAEYTGGPVPATFPIVPVLAGLQELLDDPTIAVPAERLLHGEQRFTYTRLVVPGDELTTTVTVRDVRNFGAGDVITVHAELSDAEGHHVLSAETVLVHRAAASG